jgi:hypothetical protein
VTRRSPLLGRKPHPTQRPSRRAPTVTPTRTQAPLLRPARTLTVVGGVASGVPARSCPPPPRTREHRMRRRPTSVGGRQTPERRRPTSGRRRGRDRTWCPPERALDGLPRSPTALSGSWPHLHHARRLPKGQPRDDCHRADIAPHLLGHHPDVQRPVRDEAGTVVADRLQDLAPCTPCPVGHVCGSRQKTSGPTSASRVGTHDERPIHFLGWLSQNMDRPSNGRRSRRDTRGFSATHHRGVPRIRRERCRDEAAGRLPHRASIRFRLALRGVLMRALSIAKTRFVPDPRKAIDGGSRRSGRPDR